MRKGGKGQKVKKGVEGHKKLTTGERKVNKERKGEQYQ